MPNNKRRTARATHAHRSFSHSRTSYLNSNDKDEKRRASSASSSPRNYIQPDEIVSRFFSFFENKNII